MKPLKAIFAGVQTWPGHPSFELWTILEPIPGHCALSTLARATIEAKGYSPITEQEPQ